MENARNTGNHDHAAGVGLTVKEIDELLRLFREILKLRLSELPRKDETILAECERKANQKLSEESQRRAAQAIGRPGGSMGKAKTGRAREKDRQMVQRAVSIRAEQLYREKDKDYAKAVGSRDMKIEALMKKIDHKLYALEENLPEFLRIDCEVSIVSWRQLRDSLSVGDMVAGFPVEEIIDALEAERAKVERQPAEKGQKIPLAKEQKEIVEVKPGVFGITVNIKELVRRFWKRVCSRRKD